MITEFLVTGTKTHKILNYKQTRNTKLETRNRELSTCRRRIAEMLFNPINPPSLNITLSDGISGVVSVDRIGDELCCDAVVLQRVIELVGLRRRHAKVLCIAHYQSRRSYLRCISDRGLIDV